MSILLQRPVTSQFRYRSVTSVLLQAILLQTSHTSVLLQTSHTSILLQTCREKGRPVTFPRHAMAGA